MALKKSAKKTLARTPAKKSATSKKSSAAARRAEASKMKSFTKAASKSTSGRVPKASPNKSDKKGVKNKPAPSAVTVVNVEIMQDRIKHVDCEVVHDPKLAVDILKSAVSKETQLKPVRKVEAVEVLHSEDEIPVVTIPELGLPAPEFHGDEPAHVDWDPEHDFVELREKKKKKVLRKKKALVPAAGKEVSVTADSITAYLNEIRKYPLLTKEQEIELAKHYFETKDPVAAQALVTANLRFVVKVAAEYSKFGARLIDLVQEGNMGLMHAVRDFNPYKGVRLITYAVWWIRGYIQEYLLKQYSMVKIATTQNQKRLFYRLQKEKDLLDSMGEAPNMKLIGERMGIPTAEVEQMANRLSGRDVSLNTPLDDSSSSSLMDLQKSTDVGVDDQLAAQEEVSLLREKLEELRDQLSEREKIILDERLLADDPLTLQEIGEKYGITREAVRQMEARLMKKIRDRYMASLTAVTEDETAED